jgi:hypothetical protein
MKRETGRATEATMNRDPELPNGFQDADFEMRDLAEAGRRSAALRRAGRCDHGWRQTFKDGSFECLHCHVIVATDGAK